MIGYETEEQQVQAIKRFWKENGTVIIAGAVIGLGLLWGWRYYNDTTLESQEQASTKYSSGIEAFIEDQDTQKLEAFVNENGETGYAPLASMIIAQQAVQNSDFDGAKKALRDAASADKDLSDIANLRLVSVHMQLSEYDQALSTLDLITSSAYAGQVEELRGDVLVAQGKYDEAKNAYTTALALSENNPNLEMKRDNIAYAKTKANGGNVE